MSQNQNVFIADNWDIAKRTLELDTYGKFRAMQIQAYWLEKLFGAQKIKLKELDFTWDKKSVYFELRISKSQESALIQLMPQLWRWLAEDYPLHRNDLWNTDKGKPVLSEFYREVCESDFILVIKLNPKSKRYIYPSIEELNENHVLTHLKSKAYINNFL